MSAVAAPKGSALASLKAKVPTKKTGHPVLVAEEIEAMRKQYAEASAQVQYFETLRDAAADQIKAHAYPLFLAHCQKTGKVETCLTLKTSAGEVSYTFKNQYTQINGGDEATVRTLQDRFGDDFSRYFAQSDTFTLKAGVLSDPALLARLETALGDQIGDFLEPTTTYKVTDALHADLVLRPEVREKCQDLLQTNVIKHYSPSLRLG